MSKTIADHQLPSFKTDDFGNQWLTSMSEVIMPEPISWLPAAPAWWLLLMVVAFGALRMLVRFLNNWRRNAYRRIALKQLKSLQQEYLQGNSDALKGIPLLLRQALLLPLPRTMVVALEGELWTEFLRRTWLQSEFDDVVLQGLNRLAYISPQQREQISKSEGQVFFDWCQQWLNNHRLSALKPIAESLLSERLSIENPQS
jgi:hypothetical protein